MFSGANGKFDIKPEELVELEDFEMETIEYEAQKGKLWNPVAGQNPVCDLSGPSKGNHKGFTWQVSQRKLPPQLRLGAQSINVLSPLKSCTQNSDPQPPSPLCPR